MKKTSNSQFDETLEQGLVTFGKGFSAMFHSPIKIALIAIVILACRYVAIHREAIYPENPNMLILVWILPFFAVMAFAASAPKTWDEKFETIAFKNRNGQYPQLMNQKKIKTPKGPIEELVFSSPGIPIERWKTSVDELQSAMDGTIIDIRKHQGSLQQVEMRVVRGRSIPEKIDWNDSFIREKDFELVVGEGLVDDVTFNLNKFPHVLVAGMTGSGKSVALSCMLWQCVKKGAKLYIIDFKGGVEFKNWENAGIATAVTDEDSAMVVLNHLIAEMKKRLDLFTQENVKNIQGYNKKHPESPLCRIILGCDEVAEMLDTEGLSKDDKKDKEAISQAMASLARLSRAAGIHMILGMQRPDAKVLKGQIKNNTPIRISGQFPDVVASQIVLGSDAAARLDAIPGRMLFSLGANISEFQSYWFDDDRDIKPGNYQIGFTLNKSPLGETAEPISDKDYKEFEVPKAEMAEWDWSDVNI